VEALADMTPEQLEAIEGIGPKTVEKISLAVNNYFASLESGAAVEGEVAAEGEAAAETSEAGGEEVPAEAAPSEEVATGETEAVAGEPLAATANENDEPAQEPAPEAEPASGTRE
jgi:N utilization substance protein A